jgi:cytochrome c2
MSDSPAQSVGYVALEDSRSPWPDLPLKEHTGTAGPFYLVWLKPELSGILQEEWPFKLVAFEVKGRIQELYPKIFPSNQTDLRVARGLKLFERSCFACHPINGQGAAKIGPDLNLPMNPTEYFKENVLQRYIRDPKSVRTWDGSKMPGFDQAFSDQDIGDVIEYLKMMAKERAMKVAR